MVSVDPYTLYLFQPTIKHFHQMRFFFHDCRKTCLFNKFHSCQKSCDPRHILSSYLILIVFVLVGKLCAVSSGSPIFQRLQLNSAPDIKSAGSLNSHQAFMPCKNKRICFPFICINRDTASTLRHIHDQDQSMSLCKFPDHLHILHTACHVGTVIHDQHTAVRAYCCFQGFLCHCPVYRTLHYQHRMFSQPFQIIYRTEHTVMLCLRYQDAAAFFTVVQPPNDCIHAFRCP